MFFLYVGELYRCKSKIAEYLENKLLKYVYTYAKANYCDIDICTHPRFFDL